VQYFVGLIVVAATAFIYLSYLFILICISSHESLSADHQRAFTSGWVILAPRSTAAEFGTIPNKF
jgi:hypothetical protein